jgi:cobalt-zinc-cadmium resistance protein CzcA
MLNSIVDWAVRNRLFVLLGLISMVFISAYSIPMLKLDAFPDVTNVQVTVNTEAAGLASEEVEQLITYPIEAVMYALPGVREVRSISRTGLSVVTVVFEEGTDIYFGRQLVFERLQTAKENIPEGVGTPQMGPNTSGLGQVYQYILIAEPGSGYDAMALRSLNDWVVKLMIMPVRGVTDVISFGGEVRQYQVQLDPNKLLAFDVTAEEVRAAIEDNNRNAGGWFLARGSDQLVLRAVGWIRSDKDGIYDLNQIPVKERDGVTVRIHNVARVDLGGEIRQGAETMTRRKGETGIEQLGEVVSGIVLKRMGANTNATIEGIKDRLPAIEQALPDGVTLQPFYDQADLVQKAVSTVTKAMFEAFILISVILLLFLMNVRATLLVLLSIPLSIGLALAAMSYWGISANLMSLGGLAIAIGMMADGSVVMMENIFRHLARPETDHHPQSVDSSKWVPDNIALRIQEAAREIGRPVFFAVVIIIVVFTPLFTLEGVEGKLFQPMALSIVFAMLASLLIAVVMIPALSSYLFRKQPVHRENPILKPLMNAYTFLLNKTKIRPKLVIVSALSLFLFTLALVPRLGTEFVPELEEGTLNIRVTLSPSASLETALELTPKLEAMLLSFPEVLYATSRVGRAEIGGDPEPVSNVEIFVGLKPVNEWTSADNRFELQELMEKKMSVHPGLLLSFSQPIATRVDELLSGVRAQLAIKLFGRDLDVLAEKGKEIEVLTAGVDGTTDVAMEQIRGEAQLVVRPDRVRLARYGMAVAEVVNLVSEAIGGSTAGQVINGNERYDINVRLAPEYRDSLESIRALMLQSPNGSWVRLVDVASVEIETGPPQIRRDDVQRRVVIQANVQGRDMGSVVTELDRRIREEIELPAGYSVVFGGQFENQQRAQRRLMIVVPFSLGLIFLLLYFAFRSVGQAALIMVNVPLALIGGIVALWISGQYLSVPGSIGFIALFGVAVLNGVVLVTAINQRLHSGLSRAIHEGALSRLRPVLMTALIAAFGLIPLLLSSGIGSEIQRPLATVVVGGLFTSTILTLIILPTLYPIFSRTWLRSHLPNSEGKYS